MKKVIHDELLALSQWVDDGQPLHVQANEQLMAHIRVDKITEEMGEVTEALIGMFGENPRKGFYADREKVIKELLDVAVAALGAVEHFTGNRGSSWNRLRDQVAEVHERAIPAPVETQEKEDQ